MFEHTKRVIIILQIERVTVVAQSEPLPEEHDVHWDDELQQLLDDYD